MEVEVGGKFYITFLRLSMNQWYDGNTKYWRNTYLCISSAACRDWFLTINSETIPTPGTRDIQSEVSEALRMTN